MENVTPEYVTNLESQGKKIVVDYWSETCRPCIVLTPILEKLEKEFTDITFVKINAKEHIDHLFSIGINSVPTVVLYKGGDLIEKITGLKSEDFYRTTFSDFNAK